MSRPHAIDPPGGAALSWWTRPGPSKVPKITVWFWVVKLLSTAAGEALSDFAVRRWDPVAVVIVGFVAFAIALGVQLAAPRYAPWTYWLAASMVAVFGTMAADVLHVRLGVPYLASFVAFAAVLAAVFVVWWRTERTLSIHDIDTHRREFFYWAAVLVTFALGTATGDLTAYTAGWGFLVSAVVFAAAMALAGLAYRWRWLGSVTAFWAAYIVTRPLGASMADWLGTPHNVGGLDLGRGSVSLALIAAIVVVVAMLSRPSVSPAQ